MNFTTLFETAWQTTLRYLGPVILLTLVYGAVVVFSFGILAPVTTAGYMQSLLLALREGRTPSVGDLFSEMRFFLPLTLLFLGATIAVMIGFLLLVLPGFIISAFLVFAAIYVLPLMTDRELGVFEALQESWRMAVREPITDQIVVAVVYLVAVSVGGSVLLGFLVTQPFAVFFVLAAYEERLRESEQPPEVEVPPPPPRE